MRVLLDDVPRYSQYDAAVDARLQASACGPTTAKCLLDYYGGPAAGKSIAELYRALGGTPIGLFAGRLARRLPKLLGPGWRARKVEIADALAELIDGRPVAMKFDRWSSGRWRGSFRYDYHWVVLVGFEESNRRLKLLYLDNGGRGRPSELQSIEYAREAPILSFVAAWK